MMETATFGAGCFWGVEERFSQVDGVIETAVGYMGGDMPDPLYPDVCTGETGHAEVVQLVFDPAVVSFEHLVGVFFDIHNPTTLNRQGWDVGSQYRSAIFYHSDTQENIGKRAIEQLNKAGEYINPVVTEVTPAAIFYKAEEYHQQYVKKRQGLI